MCCLTLLPAASLALRYKLISVIEPFEVGLVFASLSFGGISKCTLTLHNEVLYTLKQNHLLSLLRPLQNNHYFSEELRLSVIMVISGGFYSLILYVYTGVWVDIVHHGGGLVLVDVC